MSQSNIVGDYFFGGTLSCTTFAPPTGCITNNAIIGNAGIDYTKCQQKHCVRYSQKTGTNITSETVPIHIADGNGTIASIQVVIAGALATSSDTTTVDLKKGNSGSAYSSVLSSVITTNSSTTLRGVNSGTISSASYSDGDSFTLVVTATGSNPGQGIVVIVNFAENAA